MSTFAYIKPSNGLWKDAKIAKVHGRVLERITSLPEVVRKDKHSIELLLMVCNMIENSIDNAGKKEKLKIDKKALAMQIMASLFGTLPANDVASIGSSIEFLHDNGQIVKIPLWKMVPACMWDWCKKKLV